MNLRAIVDAARAERAAQQHAGRITQEKIQAAARILAEAYVANAERLTDSKHGDYLESALSSRRQAEVMLQLAIDNEMANQLAGQLHILQQTG